MDEAVLDTGAPGVSTAPAAAAGPMTPRRFRVRRMRRELSDTFTLELTPVDGGPLRFAPGQFTMLYVFGFGEVPISISGDPGAPDILVHTVRAVGGVTEAMGRLKPGDMLGVRGPFGTPWPVVSAYGLDLVIVAGGVGLAPLRPAILQAMAERERFGNVVILYGARTPEDILFRRELQRWRSRFDVSVHVTVDRATARWSGKVGVVTQLIKAGGFDRHHAVALVCGPELMMRKSAEALADGGVPPEQIHLSMERNMKCAVGLCGHCQYGPLFVCKDGPVFRYDRLRDLLAVWEL